MLRSLVRVAGVAVAVLLILIVGVYAAAEDLDGLPDADYIASVRFDDSPLTRAEIVGQLDSFVDSTAIGVVRVASAPDDFLNERRAYRFGSDATRDGVIDWFSPTMSGTVETSASIGRTNLSGVYALYGDHAAAERFADWARGELLADATVTDKTPIASLSYALLTVGAWVPVTAAVILIAATVTSWYVLRARARELRMLAGDRLVTIAVTDLRSLLGALAAPTAVVLVAAVALAVAFGFGRIGFFARTLAVSAAAATILTILIALCLAALTMPDVRRIAARRPPERAFWMAGETLKLVSVVIVAAIVPTTAGVIATAAAAAARGATWSALGDCVTIRVGSALDGPEDDAAFGDLVRGSAADGEAVFSMSLTSDSLDLVDEEGTGALHDLGFDGMVLATRSYLEIIGASSDSALEPVTGLTTVTDLPHAIGTRLLPTLQLWTRTGEAPAATPYRSISGLPLPVFGNMAGSLESVANPLILSIADLTEFGDSFLTSALSRGNIAFTDPGGVTAAVAASDLESLVLSIDRVADLGLYDAQSKQRNAQLAGAAIALSILALVLCVAVTAWIFALLRRRRWFVHRSAGRSWPAILRPRLAWEAAVALSFGAVMAAVLLLTERADPRMAAAAALGYFALSCGLHHWSATAAFRTTIARRG